MVTWPFRLMSTTAVLVFLTPESQCQSRSDWQFWTSADGLKESYSRQMSIGADGRLWVRHGAVNAMSVLDGYTMIQIPEARRGSAIDWNRMARIHTGVDGAAWTVENHALMSFNGTGWNTEALEGLGDTMIAAMPAAGAVLVLLADRVALYHPDSHSWRVLKTSQDLGSFSRMIPGFHSDFWITAEHGAAQLKLDANARSRSTPQASGWRRSMGLCPPRAARRFFLPGASRRPTHFTRSLTGSIYSRLIRESKSCEPQRPTIFAAGEGPTANSGPSKALRSAGRWTADGSRWRSMACSPALCLK